MAFPGNYRLPLKTGELYQWEKLYHLALAEFEAAHLLRPSSGEVLYHIAETFGYPGRNNDAVTVLKRLHRMHVPKMRDDVIDTLSWMYYRTYRIKDGINLLEEVLYYHFNRNQAHTPGTLDSGVYDLDCSGALEDALEAYRTADRMDQTPLPRVEMASFYQRMGCLDEAIRCIQEIQHDFDDNRMYYYELDRIRFAMDLHRILAALWKEKACIMTEPVGH